MKEVTGRAVFESVATLLPVKNEREREKKNPLASISSLGEWDKTCKTTSAPPVDRKLRENYRMG